eukprot:PLAT12076.2.p1 GENE.PLAT12076.2~~PLAT12076.2.p1  ORF type:complete len:284 (+),score=97.14 PLAT12076.2:13-864(+)
MSDERFVLDDDDFGPPAGASEEEDSPSGSAGSDAEEGEVKSAEEPATKLHKGLKSLRAGALKKHSEAMARRGVLYISRVPPFMQPGKVKQLLSRYGNVTRVYLVPEDDSKRKRRVARTGKRRKLFTEGWVEFEEKAVAKAVARSLHGQEVRGKRGNAHYHDIWMLKYLRKFKWHHLTEKLAYENAIRETKLKAELAQVSRENDFIVEAAEQSKSVRRAMEEKRKAGESVQARRLFTWEQDAAVPEGTADSSRLSKALAKKSSKKSKKRSGAVDSDARKRRRRE